MFARAPRARMRMHTSTLKCASECTQNMLAHTAVPLFLLREPPGLASEDRVASARARGTARGAWLPHKPAAAGKLARVATTAAPKPAYSFCIAPLASCRTTMPCGRVKGIRTSIGLKDGPQWLEDVGSRAAEGRGRRCHQGTMSSTRYPISHPSRWFLRASAMMAIILSAAARARVFKKAARARVFVDAVASGRKRKARSIASGRRCTPLARAPCAYTRAHASKDSDLTKYCLPYPETGRRA